MDDILNMFMGGGRPGGGPKKKAQVKPIVKQVEVTLADIYQGKVIEIQVDRQRIEMNDDGSEPYKSCNPCKGRGMVTKMRQMGPGMYSQST